MVKNLWDSKRGNPLLPHGILFLISSKGSFIYTKERKEMFYLTTHSTHFILQLYGIGYIHHPTDMIVHITAIVTLLVIEHWLEWEKSSMVHHEGLIWQPITQAFDLNVFLLSYLIFRGWGDWNWSSSFQNSSKLIITFEMEINKFYKLIFSSVRFYVYIQSKLL